MADSPIAGSFAALRTMFGVLGRRRWHQLWLLTLLVLFNAAADLAMVAAAMRFLAALAGQPLPGALAAWLPAAVPGREVIFAAIALAASAVIANALRLAHLRLSEAYVAAVSHELTLEVQRRVFAQPYDYHVRHHSSEVLASLETSRQMASSLIHQWLNSASTLLTGLALLALLVRLNPVPALATLAALGIAYLVVGRVSTRRLHANSAAVGAAYGERIRKVQESLGAIRDLKIDQSERARLEDFRIADSRYARASASVMVIVGAPRHLVEAAAILLVAGLAVLLRNSGGGTLVLIGGIAVAGLRLLPLLQTTYRSWANAAANRVIFEQVSALLQLPVPPDSGEEAPLPFHSSIRLEQLGYAYAERPAPVLSGVTLEIARGERIAIAGETGSGKSTLADLLMGLLQPQDGAVLIDGKPLDEGRIRAWQRNIAHVSQSSFLADASIAANIAFSVPGEAPDMERVRKAAREADIEAFIDALPEGFDTTIGEGGVRLSGGQRQRIAIARALYKQAPVLVLDEATNALDPETEARVLTNIFADKERTILIIAHRPSALDCCDRIVRIKNGRIAGS